MKNRTILSIVLSLLLSSICAQNKPRARELGIPFDGKSGKHNSITDIPGVEVGYKTLIKGEGTLKVGEGPVRTGVTVILPKGKSLDAYPMGYFIFNGDGEFTGIPSIHDFGFNTGPIGITNTYSVGVVRDAIGNWCFKNFPADGHHNFNFGLPKVGETYDGNLNDINGLHVKNDHVFEALNKAKSGPVAEGNVGGGTGMVCYWFKGGTGTSSRIIKSGDTTYTVGVLVQANFGRRQDLMIRGVPVGKEMPGEFLPVEKREGSIIVIVGTDAPLLPSQLNLVAKRVTLGVARTGTTGSIGSGDIFYAFSTQNIKEDANTKLLSYSSVDRRTLNNIFKATVEATEEAIINTLVAAEDMVGKNDFKVFALPHDRLIEILKKYNRYKKQ